MSTIIIGQVSAEVNDWNVDINVETGRGWGGDRAKPYRVLLDCPMRDLFIAMTIEQAQHLCDLIQTIARIYEKEEEE